MNTVDQQNVLGEIQRAFDKKDIAGAVTIARTLAERSPPILDGVLLVGDALLRLKQAQAVLDLILPYAEKSPDSAHLNWLVAQAYGASYQHGKAEKFLRMVVTQKPHWSEAQFAMGRNLNKAGRPSEAMPFLRQAVTAMPNHVGALFLLSISLESAGEYREALDLMRQVVALKPDHAAAQQHLADMEQIVQAPPPKNTFARWPKSARSFDDVPALIDEYITRNFDTRGIALRRGMAVFTQGSCFAGNLAISLRRYDLRVGNMPCGEEHNNTFANRAVIDWLKSGVQDERTAIVEENLGRDTRDQYHEALRNTDIFVYTMGLAAAHFDRKTSEFVMSRSTNSSQAALFRRSVFRTSSVQQNVDNLLYILNVVRELSPKAGIVLTVSPVPLTVATEFNSAITADCISKSTLRVAIHEVLAKRPPRTLYWPSFEIVRWVGAHTASVFGTDDGSSHHVNVQMINNIMDSFIGVFGDDALRASLKTTA